MGGQIFTLSIAEKNDTPRIFLTGKVPTVLQKKLNSKDNERIDTTY